MSYPEISSTSLSNLPIPLSSFIGRASEIAELQELLAEHRLLTLTGSGGCGKTRLALRIAGELHADYPDGVWLAELAALAEEELVPQAVASALSLQEKAGQPVEKMLVTYLQSRSALLLLDNCEHLIGACAELSATLLETCPSIRIVATSREPLGLPGEVVWSVPPLSLPEPRPWRDPAEEQVSLAAYRDSEAIQLFIARARITSPAFTLTIENGPWVADICRRLDGIPLAIELAAARLRMFSVRQIAERLDDCFQVLASRLRTTPKRQQTLEATLDWSYTLLSEVEQKVLQRLSVFAGGWALEAAEEVGAGDGVQAQEVPDLLTALVEKSLVVVEKTAAGRRYHLLETIRQYTRQKLENAGASALSQDQHLDYFLTWAEHGAEFLVGSGQPEWVARFDIEHDNLRAALDWSCKGEGKAGQSLRLARACGHFWRLRGYLTEGREYLSTTLSLTSPQDRTEERAWALLWAACLAYLQSDYPATRSLAEEGMDISEQLGSAGSLVTARGLDLLGEIATEVGDYETAPGLFNDALAIYRKFNDTRGIADMLMQLGWTAMRSGDYDLADAYLNECLPLLRELNETALLGQVLSGLGELAIRQGDFNQAEAFLQESLILRRDLNERWGLAVSLGSLGWVALLQRDFRKMYALLGESLEIRMEIGDQGGSAWCLEKLAQSLALQAQVLPTPHRLKPLDQAVKVLGAAASQRAPLTSVIDPADQSEYEQLLDHLRGALGDKLFREAWELGKQMPLQNIAEIALSPVMDNAMALSNNQAAKAKFGGLSVREREAAILIAQGKSNREIGESMVVKVKTVETYVTRILNKLGLDSRVQIATWALGVGLLDQDKEDSQALL